MGKVTVVGSYIVAQEIDTDRLPSEGETVIGRNYHVTHGGKGSNMTCAAARLGAQAAFLGKVGQDTFGEGFLALLNRERAGVEGVLYSDLPTGVGFIIAGPRGSHVIVVDLGANADFRPVDVQAHRDLIERSDVILSPLEIPLETALAAAQLARSKGLWTILNPAPAASLVGTKLSCISVLTPNETEARVCLGLEANESASEEALALALLDLGPSNVVITLGERGALWASRDGFRRIPALPVSVVDTVGAGDAFNAGLATALSEKRSLEESLVMAVTAASLSTQKRETIESYPFRAEVDIRLSEVSVGVERW
jgi:ribokinase